MSNSEGYVRTNYFEVEDPEKFQKWADELKVRTIRDKEGRYGLIPGEGDDDFPSTKEDEDGNEIEGFDFDDELISFLKEGSVMIMQGCGHEKGRYIYGYSNAYKKVNGEIISIGINLANIYDMVKKQWGDSPTQCSY